MGSKLNMKSENHFAGTHKISKLLPRLKFYLKLMSTKYLLGIETLWCVCVKN